MIRSTLAGQFILSPNVDHRRDRVRPRYLILHYTGMETAEIACNWLCAPESRVSCHYLIDEAGAIVQMVDEDLRAWHAGLSEWEGEQDINSLSIGIEIQNQGHTLNYRQFPAIQMEAVARLSREICQRHAIAAHHVLAHSDIAPLRKIDPGELFDWEFLHKQEVGHWVPAVAQSGGPFLQQGDTGEAVEALQGMFRLYGYGVAMTGTYDALTFAIVKAFQRHFRPQKVDGIADASTINTLRNLISALPQPSPAA